MMVLETERLLLRHLAPADLDALAAIYTDPETTRHTGGPLTRSQTWEQLRRIEATYRRRRFGLWAVVLKSNGALIGRVGLIPWTIEGREEVEVAWLLGREHWGQGLATEAGRACLDYACQRLGVSRVISLILPENSRSRRVAEKLGLHWERDVEFRGHRPGLWVREALNRRGQVGGVA